MTPETQRWLDYAREDLRIARLLLEPASASAWGAAFHAQQAAEKALKAVLVERGEAVPKTHDLERLAGLVPDDVGFDRASLAPLTAYAVASRYPDDLVLPSMSEAERAVEIAARVVAAVEAFLS